MTVHSSLLFSFGIINGKSSTGTIEKDGKNKQVLDKLQVERERGITVKAQVRFKA